MGMRGLLRPLDSHSRYAARAPALSFEYDGQYPSELPLRSGRRASTFRAGSISEGSGFAFGELRPRPTYTIPRRSNPATVTPTLFGYQDACRDTECGLRSPPPAAGADTG